MLTRSNRLTRRNRFHVSTGRVSNHDKQHPVPKGNETLKSGPRVVMFGEKPYEHFAFEEANKRFACQLDWLESRLTARTAQLSVGADAACIFVNDTADAEVLGLLASVGVQHLALRCAGFNHVDIASAQRLGITVTRVPAYSPNAVAEHTIALILAVNRHIHKAYSRVRDGNFALEGLVGFDLCGKTVGVIGTGRIGGIVARLLRSFQCNVLAMTPMNALS